MYSYPFQFQFRTQNTNYLMIACRSTYIISSISVVLVTFREIRCEMFASFSVVLVFLVLVCSENPITL